MKIVLFTQRVEVIEQYGERRDSADQRIAEFIDCCGYLPVPVPNNEDRLINLVNAVMPKGIFLTGGNSMVKYGGIAPERDQTDQRLIEIALKQGIPIYGFCRGMQSILDYFGNKLTEVKNHVALRHVVRGETGSCEVNSFHNEGCKELSNNELKIIYRSDDGVIEMIQHRSKPIVGTMWHPEREDVFREWDIQMVQNLIG